MKRYNDPLIDLSGEWKNFKSFVLFVNISHLFYIAGMLVYASL